MGTNFMVFHWFENVSFLLHVVMFDCSLELSFDKLLLLTSDATVLFAHAS